MHYYGDLYGKAGNRSFFPTGKTGKDWDELEKERDHLRDAIRKAAAEHKAVKWGWDGDCGTDEIMERLEANLPENA